MISLPFQNANIGNLLFLANNFIKSKGHTNFDCRMRGLFQANYRAFSQERPEARRNPES